jgi:hypothetical protein
MSQVAQETPQEFWRPPIPVVTEEVVVPEAEPIMAETCGRCGSEFLLGSRFCHSCGGRRLEARRLEVASEDALADAAAIAGLWRQAVGRVHSGVTGLGSTAGKIWNAIAVLDWVHYLHFDEIKRWVGLSTGSLIAFVIGIACVAGALLVGLLTAKTYVDWQAIQFYRAEWLLAATAAFVAGILLKKSSGPDGE